MQNEIATWFVVVMGMGIVFIGLVCLIVLISIMGAIMKRVNAKQEAALAAARANMPARSPAPAAAPAEEELGKDVKAIRIHSIKRV